MKAENQERIKATSPTGWIVGSLLILLLLALLLLGIVPMEQKSLITAVAGAAIVFPQTLWNLANCQYLTAEGVETCRWGRVVRRLPWEQVAWVGAVRANNNSNRVLLIIPKDCEPYDKKLSGQRYLLKYRNGAVAVDNTKQNREFMERHFGAIQNY